MGKIKDIELYSTQIKHSDYTGEYYGGYTYYIRFKNDSKKVPLCGTKIDVSAFTELYGKSFNYIEILTEIFKTNKDLYKGLTEVNPRVKDAMFKELKINITKIKEKYNKLKKKEKKLENKVEELGYTQNCCISLIEEEEIIKKINKIRKELKNIYSKLEEYELILRG